MIHDSSKSAKSWRRIASAGKQEGGPSEKQSAWLLRRTREGRMISRSMPQKIIKSFSNAFFWSCRHAPCRDLLNISVSNAANAAQHLLLCLHIQGWDARRYLIERTCISLPLKKASFQPRVTRIHEVRPGRAKLSRNWTYDCKLQTPPGPQRKLVGAPLVPQTRIYHEDWKFQRIQQIEGAFFDIG